MSKQRFEKKALVSASYHELKEHKNNRRIWLEGEDLNDVSFAVDTLFRVECDIDNMRVILRAVPSTPENIALHKKRQLHKVSGRKMTGWVKPIIDVCNANITEVFKGAYGEQGRFAAYAYDGVIVFTTHPEDAKRIEREVSLARNLAKGEITEGSAFTGIGISTNATHDGYKKAGLKPTLKWAVELEGRYLDAAKKNSPDVFSGARLFKGYIEEVEKDLVDPVNSFSFSMSCTDHSNVGKAKKGLSDAEDGDTATQIFGVMGLIKAANPAILISENVPSAQNSFTYKVMKKELERTGYNVYDLVLGQTHSGSLDRRQRYWFIAVSKGLNIAPEMLIPSERDLEYKNVGEILDKDCDLEWTPLTKFEERQAKNIAEGRNFKMNLVDETTTVVGTIPRNYTKRQVSNPHLTDHKGNYRLFSKIEHARLKLVPPRLVGHLSETVAHEGLGQGIAYTHGIECSYNVGVAVISATQPQYQLALAG
jgi:DNA (cytosine-5)-methyltransferase 1